MPQGVRLQRIADQIQRELALSIQREVKDPRLGFLTVSGVKVSSDLSYADVYYTLMGDDSPEAIAQSGVALGSAAGFLRGQLGRAIRLRTMPRLRFHYDQTLISGRHLSNLIDEAVGKHRTAVIDPDHHEGNE